jgi:hypothetical protein
MSAASALAAGRRAAELLMVDTCTITRAGAQTTDDLTGDVTSTPDTVYAGKCRVQQQVAFARSGDVGEATRWFARLELHLPATTVGVQVNDQVTITASVHDPDLVGRTFEVRGLAHKTYPTAHRLQIEEVA